MENSDFVSKFYNLQGDLISERKRNFFKLLKSQAEPLNDEDLNNLRPRNYLEKLFQIDIYIYFKIHKKLLDVIREGNEVYISKILKHPLILKEVIGNISGESFVNDFLPCTSYAIRMKILKRISFFLDEHQMDEIIFWVHKRYGFNIATKILHTCSSKKIQEYLSNHDVKLKPRQFKFIFDKDPELFLIYLMYYKKLTGCKYDYQYLSDYIALRNPELWLKLKNENIMKTTTLGRKTSKKFLVSIEEHFLSNVEYYSNFLKLSVVVRKLQGNFRNVYFEYFPRDKNNLCTNNFSHRLLKYYPEKRQWNMFEGTFMRVFKNSILDNFIYLDSSFISFFPNKIILNNWAEVHYNEDKSNYYLKYCSPTKAIPLIKEKINVTSDIHERTKLVNLLLENCSINNDFIFLEKIVKYICFRHRNKDTLPSILNRIGTLFKFKELNENHLNYINEIVTTLRLKKLFNYYCHGEYVLKYIEYLVTHQKSFRKELMTYMKDGIESSCSWFNMNIEDPQIEKQIRTEMFNIYPTVLEMDENQFKEYHINFINDFLHFNERNPEYRIDFSNFPSILSHITSILEQDWKSLEYSNKDILIRIIGYNFKFSDKPIVVIEEDRILKLFEQAKDDFSFDDIVEKIIKKRIRSKFENKVLQFFWDNLLDHFYLCRNVVHWLFLNEPKTVIPYYDHLLTLDQTCAKAADIKLMSHLGFDEKLRAYCIKKLEKFDNYVKEVLEKKTHTGDGDEGMGNEQKKKIKLDMDKKLIDILSTLLSTVEYIEIVENTFLPFKEKLKVTGENEELNEIYFWQCEVAKSLKKMQEPAATLPTLMKFCLGDYLQSALPSLYSICYRAPEKLLYSYMDVLSKRGVSTRKHALFLSCELLNFDYVLNTLQNANESNVSSQKHVFSATSKYFNKNPSEELLNMVAINLNTIDKNDEETLKNLVKIVIPMKYTPLYIEKCWYFFENMRMRKEVNVQDYLDSFLEFITSSQNILILLPDTFCRHIITHYFKDLPEKDYYLSNIINLVCLLLQNKKSEQTYNFKFVFDIISIFKNNKSSKIIKNFFNIFYRLAAQDLKCNHKIDVKNNYHIELFKQHWFNCFMPLEMFNERVLLDLLYLKSRSCNVLETYAQEVVLYLENLVIQYGPHIYNKFKDLVLSKELFTKEEKYLFLYNVLNFKSSTLNCLLVIDLLERLDTTHTKEIYNKIIDILKNATEPIVSVYLNSHLGL